MTSTFDEPDRPALLAALEDQRASVRSVVAGLGEEHWHTSVVPSGWTPAGLVAHLGGAERHWAYVICADDPGHPFDADSDDEPYDPDAPFVIDWPSSKVLGVLPGPDAADGQSAGGDEAGFGAPRAARHGGRGSAARRAGNRPSSHRETAAHSGHLEIARELLDGKTRPGLR